jgi:hypothetical protein
VVPESGRRRDARCLNQIPRGNNTCRIHRRVILCLGAGCRDSWWRDLQKNKGDDVSDLNLMLSTMPRLKRRETGWPPRTNDSGVAATQNGGRCIATDLDTISATTTRCSHSSPKGDGATAISEQEKAVLDPGRPRDWPVWKRYGTCESLSGVYSLKRCCKHVTDPTSWSPHIAARDIAGTTRTLSPRRAPRSRPIHASPQPPPPTLPITPLSFAATRNLSAQTVPGDVTREVALKAIPKKKIKWDEESLWSEMGCSRVSIIQTSWVPSTPFMDDAPARACPHLCPNMFGYLSVGQIIQMVRISDKILLRFRARCRRQAL